MEHSASNSTPGRKLWFYEQLGAPTLLCRNTVNYEPWDDHLLSYQTGKKLTLPEAVNESEKEFRRVKTRWYYPVDPRVARQREYVYEEESDSMLKKAAHEARADPFQQTCRLGLLLASGRSKRESLEILRGIDEHDQPYVQTRNSTAVLDQPQLYSSFTWSQQRKHGACPEYLAPFGSKCIMAAMAEPDDSSQSARKKSRIEQDENVDAHSFGNTLVVLKNPKPADKCVSDWLILYPFGNQLNEVRISSLLFPTDSTDASQELPSAGVLVGDTVLELKQCGPWSHSCPLSVLVAARTQSDVTILKVLESYAPSGYPPCPFGIVVHARVDLRSLSSNLPSYTPVSLACHPKYGGHFTPAKLAFVSRAHHGAQSTIHHFALSSSTRTSEHGIRNLSTIDLIDFTREHPLCLWAVARSHVTPAPCRDAPFQRPSFGKGRSLFRVDLRSDKAIFEWSPSANEKVTEGVFSISSILTDWTRENTVWVQSSSAGKTWQLDTRSPCKPVATFSLGVESNDFLSTMPRYGFHGEGNLMTLPLDSGSSPLNTMVSVDKAPGCHSFIVRQPPLNPPLFQTRNIEVIGTPGIVANLDDRKASVAVSNSFPLADVSYENALCGLAAIRVPLSKYFSKEECQLLEVSQNDSHALCVLTVSSKGDIFSHSLLETDRERVRSTSEATLPLGASSVSLSPMSTAFRQSYGRLQIQLSSTYPKPSSCIQHLSESRYAQGTLFRLPDVEGGDRSERVQEYSIPQTSSKGVYLLPGKAETRPVSLPMNLFDKSKKALAAEIRQYPYQLDNMVTIEASSVKKRSDVTSAVIEASDLFWDESDESLGEC